MNAKNLLPTKRRLTFSVLIISLIVFFFSGYYFYFIPGNKVTLHKNGFVILENIQKNIKDRNGDLQKLFSSFLTGKNKNNLPDAIRHLQNILDSTKIGGTVFTDSTHHHFGKKDSAVLLTKISNDTFFYQLPIPESSVVQVQIPAANFIEPMLAYQKKELFGAYLLISKNAGLIYTDPALALAPGITADSLINKNKEAFFAGIKDIKVEDAAYKMFYYPFKLGNDQLYLCGFVKANDYTGKLNQVPVTFIYPIVIALMLIVILLPIIKFYMMGKDEHIRYADFVFGVLSFFVGSAMFTIIIIQVLLLMAADIRAEKNLASLSEQIDSSFINELTVAYRQLDKIDNIFSVKYDSFKNDQHDAVNPSLLLKNYFAVNKGNTSLYYNFDRITWTDSTGQQKFRAQKDDNKNVLTNVEERKYFQVIKNGGGYPLPGEPDARFGFEPVNSWTNGEFSIIISKKSRLKQWHIASISAQMYAVMQATMPPGFGYCIIDNDGNVLLHSEMNRNLQENFISKTDPSRLIKEAIVSRQLSFFPNVELYGKTNAVRIQPIEKLPFHLITFYDKGYIVPVNMRIFSFSAIFCITSFFVCLLLWFGVFRKKYPGNAVLYSPMRYLKWVLPQKKDAKFYTISSIFLLAYVLMSVLVLLMKGNFTMSNYAVLVLALLMPVNIFSGLFVINYRVKKDITAAAEKEKQENSTPLKVSPVKALKAILLQLLAGAGTFFLSTLPGSHYLLPNGFLYYQLIFTALLMLFFLLPKKALQSLYVWQEPYLFQYSFFVTLLIICLSVMPAAVYTWYAHNQEITQAVKKEQLYLAGGIQQRAAKNAAYCRDRDSLAPPPEFFYQQQYRHGIYTIYQDTIWLNDTATADTSSKKEQNFEQFYFSIANDIGNNYYDPLLIPALKDSATDKAWYWLKEKDTLSFWYGMYAHPDSDTFFTGNKNKPLKIISRFPDRYTFITPDARGAVLAVFILAFLIGLYMLLRYISERLFLKKYIDDTENSSVPANAVLSLFAAYKSLKESRGQSVSPLQQSDVEGLKNEYAIFKPVPGSSEMYKQEKLMMAAAAKFKNFYDFIWEKCTPKEKYLLLDHAQNGFVNFKNTEVITHLLQQGIFVIRYEEMQLFSASFRAYVLSKKSSPEIEDLKKEFQQGSAWQTFRMPLLIILLGIALFIFFTQEQTFQKIMALVAGISSIVSLLLKFFTDGGSLFSAKK